MSDEDLEEFRRGNDVTHLPLEEILDGDLKLGVSELKGKKMNRGVSLRVLQRKEGGRKAHLRDHRGQDELKLVIVERMSRTRSRSTREVVDHALDEPDGSVDGLSVGVVHSDRSVLEDEIEVGEQNVPQRLLVHSDLVRLSSHIEEAGVDHLHSLDEVDRRVVVATEEKSEEFRRGVRFHLRREEFGVMLFRLLSENPLRRVLLRSESLGSWI